MVCCVFTINAKWFILALCQEKKIKQEKGKNLLDRLVKCQEEALSSMYDFRVPFSNNQTKRDLRTINVKENTPF